MTGVGFRSNNFARHFMKTHRTTNHEIMRTLHLKRLQKPTRSVNKKNFENVEQLRVMRELVCTSTTTNIQVDSDVFMSTNTLNDQIKKCNIDLKAQRDRLQQKLVDERNKWKNDMLSLKKSYDTKSIENDRLKTEVKQLNAEISAMKNFMEKTNHGFVGTNQLLIEANNQLQNDLVVMKEFKVNYDALKSTNDQLMADCIEANEIRKKYEALAEEHNQFTELYNMLYHENVELKSQDAKIKFHMDRLKSQYDELNQTQQKLKDEKKKWEDDAVSVKKLYETALKENELLKSENKRLDDSFPMDKMNCSLERLSSVDWCEKAKSLETDLNEAQSELYLSQMANRDILHSLLDLQGKVRMMARLQPAVNPFRFVVNSHQNQLKRKSKFLVFNFKADYLLQWLLFSIYEKRRRESFQI